VVLAGVSSRHRSTNAELFLVALELLKRAGFTRKTEVKGTTDNVHPMWESMGITVSNRCDQKLERQRFVEDRP